jgi:pimeloyl-ACP methyl ester carboxylesterase
LVFLHEGLGSLDQWRDFPAAVRAKTGWPTTLVYSRRGYGTSEPHGRRFDRGYMHEEARSELPALLEALAIQEPLLIGHSDGATIALIHAAAGHRVSGVVAIAPHVFVEDRTLEGIRAATAAYDSGDLRGRLQRHHRDADGVFEAWSRVWLDPGFRSWSITEELGSIAAPILVVQGVDDRYGTSEQVDAIRRHAGGPVETHLIDGAGHAPQFERPDEVLRAIVSFWDDCQYGFASSPTKRPG